ncbi:hypothetical protein LLH23_02885 [bacterium]|nr:hypothetical protein [bacterium]
MRATLTTVSLLALLTGGARADTIRIVDLTGGSSGLPMAQALTDLHGRVQTLPAGEALPIPPGVVVLDGASDLSKLPAGDKALEGFVSQGGGVLIAGLPDSLPATAPLWRALGAAAPADAIAADLFPDDSGNWMWIGTQPGESDDHIRYIRRSFEITKPVKRAFVRCTADNLYWVYLNGEQIGYHWSWFDNELWDLGAKLRQGKNTVAFKARNVDGPGGFFAQIGLEYEDGTKQLIVSGKAWKFHIPEEPNWAAVDYDDSAWRPAADIKPMAQHTHIYDRGVDVEGPVTFPTPHPITNALTDRFGTAHHLRGVLPRSGATTVVAAGGRPLVLCSEYGQGRVVLMDALPGSGLLTGDLSDDLLATAILWLGRQTEGLTVARPVYPPPTLRRGGGVQLSYALDGVTPTVDGTLTATVTHNAQATVVGTYPLHAGQALQAAWTGAQTRSADADGPWQLDLAATDTAGQPVFHRSLVCEVTNPLSLPGNRHVVAQGMTLQVQGDLKGLLTEGKTLKAAVVDPWGREQPVPEPTVKEGVYTWAVPIPDLMEGDYRLVVTLLAGGQVADSFGAPFTVVPRLDLRDFYPTTMRLSPLRTSDPAAIAREIDDIIAHGFNTLTFSARRLGAKPGSPYDVAEDLAQQKGMAVSYSFQGDFSLLRRDGLPPVSVFSPEYKEALRPRIEAAIATCKQVPRLLNVQGYMDEPFQVSGQTCDNRPPAQAEFKRRYGIEMPTREQAMADPALWLKYVDFWSDCFAADWRQGYALVKELDADFWVELTHDSHCTFGAAGRNFKGFWAVDDVFHWGAPFDSVNYDIYPYLSTDFRSGKFQENRLPRIAGMHMAFAQMRNLAYTYHKKLGFWVEAGWGTNLGPEAPGRRYPWSPRELTYTSVAAGCDYLNTFWGLPEDPAWWETYRSTMSEVKSLAPLLTRSAVPRAKAAFLFPRTQHVLLQEEYWNVMVALEAFRQAYGELDCLHEEQIAKGGLDNYRVLVLCDIHLLKRQEAEAIRAWVQRGGLLIADEVPSQDEGKQPLGVFEPVFGVTGDADIADVPVTIPGTKAQLPGRRSYQQQGQTALVYNSPCGKGRATLLNFQLKDCYLDALVRQNADGAADAILDLLRNAAAGCPANVTSSTPGIEAALRQTAQGTTLLLLINHESKLETTQVTLPYLQAGGVVRDMVTGERLKPGPKHTLMLKCPWGGTRVLGLFPSDPQGLRLEGLGASYSRGAEVAYGLIVGGKSIRGNYLLDVSVTTPDGRKLQAFSALTCTEDATCRRRFRLPVNAPAGKWTLRARSLWDGAEATGSFAVK